jgi:hypothetical protein
LRIKGRISRASLAALTSGVAVLLFAVGAQAQTVTVGPAFGGAEFPVGCPELAGCALAIPSAPIPSNATIAPISGNVVSWSIAGASAVPGYNLVVLRQTPTNKYTVTAASPVVTPAGGAAQSFPSSLPIQAGEIVGVNYPTTATIGALPVTSTVASFSSTLTMGAEAAPFSESSSPISPAFNATIESPPTLQPPVLQPPVTQPVAPAPTPEAHCVVPKLNGKKLKAAKKKIRAAECKVGLVSKKNGVKVASGKVIKQSPKAGKVLPVHTGVSVKLG